MIRLLYWLVPLFTFSVIIQCAPTKSKDIIKPNMQSYDTLWKNVDAKEQEGLPKSSLEIVDNIYHKAKSEGDKDQELKALIYRAKYMGELDESGIVKSIRWLEDELKNEQDPVVKAVLHSYLGDIYNQYHQMKIWEIRRRTPIANNTNADIESWSSTDYLKRIRFHYDQSVQEPKLRSIPVKDLERILTDAGTKDNNQNADLLRPTLYDVLAHRAIDYYLNSISDRDESDEDLVMDDPALFGFTDVFVKSRIKDTSSSKEKAISLFQSIESFHQKDKDPSAWLDIVQKRLGYVHEHFTGADKDQLYEAALNQWINQWKGTQNVAPFLLNKAYLFQSLGNQYNSDSPDSLYDNYLQEAVLIYQSIIHDYPKSKEAKQAINALNEIKRPHLYAEVEKVNLITKPFRLLLNYKNVPSIFVKIIPVSNALRQEFYGQPIEKNILRLLELASVQNFKSELPAHSDNHDHRVELKVDGLESGLYAILLSGDGSFKMGSSVLSLIFTNISNLAYMQTYFNYSHPRLEGHAIQNEIVIVDRNIGSPVADAKITYYEQTYDPKVKRYIWNQLSSTSSDKDGKVSNSLPPNKSYTVKIEKGNDQLWLDDAFSNNSYVDNGPKESLDVMFFTDRSIYRPGQTIYFKGLILKRETNGKASIIRNRNVEVSFLDANGQPNAKKSFVSNEFGSFNGSFMTPSSGLLGSMSLIANLSQSGVNIQVEEYKRPKFEIQFDTNNIVSRLNESVTISGHAKNFAGNVVDNAQVKYKVTRARWQRPMPWWGWSRKTYMPYDLNPQIIAQGVTSTDALGKYTIPFIAKAQPGVDLNKDEVSYSFAVEIDITDFTGETRSNTLTTRIGNKNILINGSLKQSENRDSLKQVILSITDLNGIALKSAKGHLTIQKLIQPDRFYRKRYWQKADQYILSESEYHQLFPTDVYNDEDQVSNWLVEKSIVSTGFQSDVPVNITPSIEAGVYKLTATSTDTYKQTTTYEHYFYVSDVMRKIFPSTDPLVMYQDKSILQPGEVMSFTLRSLFSPQYILQSSSRAAKSNWIINNGVITDNTKLDESNRGEFHQYTWYMVRDNRAYTNTMSYGIDWSNKDLDIQTISFRDKLLPGQQEEWKLKISGKDKEKFVSEIVASMYDKSLDELYPHSWRTTIFNIHQILSIHYSAIGFQALGSEYSYQPNEEYEEVLPVNYRDLDLFGFHIYSGILFERGGRVFKSTMSQANDGIMMESKASAPAAPGDRENISTGNSEIKKNEPPIQLRKNLNETVFFYPDIKSDADGNFILKFKMNEALTQWRLMLFAHTTDLKNGYAEREILTQKDLMVFPNGPRFLRQNDQMEFPAKVSNLSDHIVSGNARLELYDPASGKSLDKDFNLISGRTSFNIPAGQSHPLTWNITVPDGYTGMLGYRVIAEAGNMMDGEENVVPVLTNRMLVTETMPFNLRAKQEKTFVFEEMKTKMVSSTLRNQSFSLECTSNPVWYAIQSLPYLMEYPHECTEQIVNRYYANALAAKIVEQNPKIKTIFDDWNRKDQFKSPLVKNQELKSAILEETPWVKDAMDEAEQQKMIALLFDVNRMANEKSRVVEQLQSRQLSNGGFPWFEGRDDWFITQYVIEDLGHLKKLGITSNELDEVLQKAVNYCDQELVKYFEETRRVLKKDDIGLPEIAQHYLYARSFYREWPIENRKAFDYFLAQAEKDWLKQNLYNQGMLALAINRWKADSPTPGKILASLNEKAQHQDDLGMYWKFQSGYRYFELPIETQAILIEAFSDISKDQKKVDEMRIWLLENKQTNKWSSTKGTAAAIYALMLNGNTEWINESQLPAIHLGGEQINPGPDQVISGIGYFKIKKESSDIKPSLANLIVANPNNHIVWGAAYWQYFEDLNKVTTFKTMPISIKKQMFVESMEGNKKSLKPFTELRVGDRLIVRLELKVDRPMDYLHLKDMRAAGLEPINVISEYKYQGGIGYYESTKDIATNFFIDHISAGTYVLEYPLRVTQRGTFSNGISTLQCMYAPEFSTHSGGDILLIK